MTSAAARPWWPAAGGLEVRLRLTPRARTDAIDGRAETPEGPVFTARVRAVPSGGEANAALSRLLAGRLGLPGSTVTLAAGGRSRLKTLRLAGDARDLAACLEKLWQDLARG